MARAPQVRALAVPQQQVEASERRASEPGLEPGLEPGPLREVERPPWR